VKKHLCSLYFLLILLYLFDPSRLGTQTPRRLGHALSVLPGPLTRDSGLCGNNPVAKRRGGPRGVEGRLSDALHHYYNTPGTHLTLRDRDEPRRMAKDSE